ncbi:MAG: Ig-like domain-containing protein, partial [Terracidiphilus sp.]
SSTAPLNQVINQAPTVTTVSATPTQGIAATPETISATVALAVGTAIPAGTVTFTSAGTTLGSAPLNSSGVATITSTFAVGSYQIVATYSGNASMNGSTSASLSCTIAVATTQTTLTVTPSPAQILNPVTFTATVKSNGAVPTGSVNLLANGEIIGTSPLNSSGVAIFSDTALPAGSYSMTAEYLGNSTDAMSTSPAVSEIVGITPTITELGTASTSGTDSQVILLATVTNNGNGLPPTGTVKFYNGTTSLGTATLDSSGVATIVPNLISGTKYNVDAVYSGDTDHSTSTSQVVGIAGTAPMSGSGIAFTVTVTPNSINVESSQNITMNVTLASIGSSADTVNLGCASLPAVVNCHFASVSLKLPAGGTVSTQLTIDTNSPLSGGTTALIRRVGTERISLAGLFLPLSLGCIFWRLRRRNPGVFSTALILVLSATALIASGCNNFSQASAAPGTYVIQITGTGTTTNVIEYQNVTLNITK